ncbi:Gfo/Idh/MocA family oxidoreductase [Pontibacter akesuensis]|uniref:Predicted dehydrogenase n=1 Tax=Pontibacter akesuensis TaxID=388950 RepID=A0A1I7H5J6_9BACT|nr:Gfo/Idh/MocA family oxidoreductase [Pontibacter akesuensis]GHA53291.1 hypothetical protein GCM10007389_00530 [Pontibacter akesuensis]SFU55985.1 Predicted dehydrogenase [Pontibacter akesuensis]
MKNNLIVGAGQLGSRHLQGLLKYNKPQNIFVIDPSVESLRIAQQRSGEVEHMHKVYFVSNWDKLPNNIDIAIIATNAGVRESVVTKLLEDHAVKFLILEKVLFQKQKSYDEVRAMLLDKGVATWVNHPRRMMRHFQQIKQEIQSVGTSITLHTYGMNWGLACNGIHFIDLVSYLSGSSVDTLDAVWVENEVLDSKRSGHIEFVGTIKGTLENGSLFTITSDRGTPGILTTSISADKYRWIVTEGAGNEVVSFNHENKAVVSEYTVEYQSTLTTRLAEQLFKKGTCDLPTYEEAYQAHVPYLEVLLEKYQQLSGQLTDTCPIT